MQNWYAGTAVSLCETFCGASLLRKWAYGEARARYTTWFFPDSRSTVTFSVVEDYRDTTLIGSLFEFLTSLSERFERMSVTPGKRRKTVSTKLL
jgi:hypothetical protein